MCKKCKNLLILLAIVFIPIAIFICIGVYFYKFALDPKTDKSKVFNADHNKMESDEKGIESDSELKEKEEKEKKYQNWLENVEINDRGIYSHDNLFLHGEEIVKENSNKWVILCHGYYESGKGMLRYAKKFHDKGFNVLLPSARAHGQSEGDYIGMGWHDRLDIVDWINKIIEAKGSDVQIMLYGVSMGGATVMMVSGEDLPENVKVIVEDCGYSSTWEEFAYQLKATYGLPSFPVLHAASLVSKVKAGFSLEEANAVSQVRKSKTPTLFIHGTDDTFVPYEMVYKVYEALDAPKDLIIVEGAGHGKSWATLKYKYWENIWNFVDDYIV
ncbi:MAG: alpha/beta hydrolase [Lachnospirales bacterium]